LRTHGGNLREAAERYGVPEQEILDFSANINPLGPPPGALAEIKRCLSQVRHYPDSECWHLRQALASYEGVAPEEVLPANGVAELIFLIPRALPIESALIPSPTFSEYEVGLRAAGGRPRFLILKEEKGFRPSTAQILHRAKGVQAVFLCNPNNPTGVQVPQEELKDLAQLLQKRRILLILDEAFSDFRGRGQSLASAAPGLSNLLVLRSLTKFFAVPGLRLGYAIGPPRLLARLQAAKDPWSVNLLAQRAGISCVLDETYQQRSREVIAKESDSLFQALGKLPGLKLFPSAANFLLLKVERGPEVKELQELLGRKGILIRNREGFRFLGPRFFRVAVRAHPENERLIQALRQALGQD